MKKFLFPLLAMLALAACSSESATESDVGAASVASQPAMMEPSAPAPVEAPAPVPAEVPDGGSAPVSASVPAGQ